MRRPADSDRALFWTLAIAAFAAAAVALAARAIDRTAATYESERRDYAIARVISPETPEALTAAAAVLANSPLVESAAPMTAGRAAALLREWGGAPITEAQMPALRLIEIELGPASAGPDVEADLVAALQTAGLTAEVMRAPEGNGAGDLASRTRLAAFVAAVLFAAVMALIVSLAARGLAARRSDLVHVLADLGATRGQAAGRVADEAARVGFAAGAVGALLAAILGAGLMLLFAPVQSLGSLREMIVPFDLAPLVATPLVAAVAAAMGARAGAESFYAQAARLA